MLKLYFLLFYEFLKTGFFAIGGGYAALPFLFEIQRKYNWFSIDELTNMIAVSNITPGPVGINCATYAGFKTAGIFGAFIATFSIIIIPFIIAVIIAKIFDKFKTYKIVQDIFLGLRPAACALLASVSVKLLNNTLKYSRDFHSCFDYGALFLFILLLSIFWFFKKNPLIAVLAGAVAGITLKPLFL